MLYRRSASRTYKGVILIAFAVILSILIPIFSASCNARTHTLTGNAFGSYYSVEYMGDNRDDELRELISALDEAFAVNGSGDIASINASPVGKSVKVNSYTFRALTLAFEIACASDEAFTPAAYPLTELWAFAPDNYIGAANSIPSEESVGRTLKTVGTEHFALGDEQTVTKLTDGAGLDLGGIGKGFAADEVSELLGEDLLVADFGATFRVTAPVKISIQNPRGSNLVAEATVSYSSVATSGDYQRFYVVDGVRYNHIMGRDGYPAGHFSEDPVISATVTSPSAALSDALSTAAMVLGNSDELSRLLEKYDASCVLFTETERFTVGNAPFEFILQK